MVVTAVVMVVSQRMSSPIFGAIEFERRWICSSSSSSGSSSDSSNSSSNSSSIYVG